MLKRCRCITLFCSFLIAAVGGTSCIMGNARAHYLLLLNIRVHLLFQNVLRYICRKQLR